MSNTTSTIKGSSERTYVAPRNQVEQSLAVIWSETLKRDINSIGINDSLQDLGALHSLTIVQMIGRIADEFGVELPIADVVTHPTISQVAELIGAMRGAKTQA
ncbi:MAG TPA: phosphopantetheine-binding protein [Candidatus Angelobacter sp.]|nr:phosphopantetheine-binding protein [Candidatus Angelobacter sp.]